MFVRRLTLQADENSAVRAFKADVHPDRFLKRFIVEISDHKRPGSVDNHVMFDIAFPAAVAFCDRNIFF